MDVGQLLQLQQQLLGHLHPFLASIGPGQTHTLPRPLAEGDAGDFVVQKAGVFVALQGQHADQHGHGEGAVALFVQAQKVAPQLRIIDGLGHGEVGAAADLALEAVHLFFQIGPGGVTGHGDGEAALAPHLLARLVIALVELVDDAHQPDAVHIVDRGAALAVPQAGRIPGQGQDIAHTDGVGADQVGLQAHQRAVTGGEVEDGLDVHLLLDHGAEGQRAHAHPGHGAVGHVDGVRAHQLGVASALDLFLGREAPGRVHLHGDRKVAGVQLLQQARGPLLVVRGDVCAAADPHFGQGFGHVGPGAGRAGLALGRGVQSLAHGAQVHGRGAATAADQPGPTFQETLDRFAKILRAGRIVETSLHPGGETGVGLDAQGKLAAGRVELAQGLLQRGRADGAVGPDHIHAQGA